MSISPDEYHAMIKCASCSVRIKTRDSFDASKQFRCPKCKTHLKVSGCDPERTMAIPETAIVAPAIPLAITGAQEFTSKSSEKSEWTWMLLLAISTCVLITVVPTLLLHDTAIAPRAADKHEAARTKINSNFADLANEVSTIVASRSILAGIDTPANNQAVFLAEAGREGLFKFSTANLTSAVSLDAQQGIYVAPTAASTGASGAWVRAFDGPANAKWWGAKGDGSTNDTTSLQAAFDYVCTATSPCTELHLSAGIYRVTNVNITTAMGITIRGDSRLRTAIRATSTNPALSINGLWFSKIEGISFETETNLTNKGVVEQDGNYDGSNVQGTQGITWSDCWFDGRGTSSGGLSTYSFAMNRQGSSSAQGSECIFLNCHWLGASTACYYQYGFNALNNTIIGGNFQVYSKHAVYTVGGVVNLYSVGFQSTYGYNQVVNDGFDIDVGTVGANEGIVVSGCRTESMRFIRAGGANRADVRACVGVLSLSTWFASTAYGTAQAQGKAVQVQSLKRIFVATTEGTSGSVEPTWPTDGISTVADGTIIWQELIYYFMDVGVGSVSRETCGSDGGRIKSPEVYIAANVTANYKVKATDNCILVDATSGPVTLTLPVDGGGSNVEVRGGHVFTVKKVDTSANAVTLISPVIGFENGGGGYVIAGGAVAARTFVMGNVVAGVTRWILIAKD